MIPPAHKAAPNSQFFLDVTVCSTYTCGLASLQNAAVLFVDVAIQPEKTFLKVKRVSERPDHREENCRLARRAVLLARWIVRSIAVRNCWEQWTREGTHARKTGSGVTRKTTRKRVEGSCCKHLLDTTVTRSMIRADVGVAIVPQTISRYLAEAILKSKRSFQCTPFNTGTSTTASTVVPSQFNVECHRLAKSCV
ncbi:HTH_Tnp_Tc3_2 domain-containing protein [Trichonephila clavipes]|nr:HTH_Tnp_Tc3_2 domain-containing protein [Trichonephila clavipes]